MQPVRLRLPAPHEPCLQLGRTVYSSRITVCICDRSSMLYATNHLRVSRTKLTPHVILVCSPNTRICDRGRRLHYVRVVPIQSACLTANITIIVQICGSWRGPSSSCRAITRPIRGKCIMLFIPFILLTGVSVQFTPTTNFICPTYSIIR